jgi:hypothetical protein
VLFGGGAQGGDIELRAGAELDRGVGGVGFDASHRVEAEARAEGRAKRSEGSDLCRCGYFFTEVTVKGNMDSIMIPTGSSSPDNIQWVALLYCPVPLDKEMVGLPIACCWSFNFVVQIERGDVNDATGNTISVNYDKLNDAGVPRVLRAIWRQSRFFDFIYKSKCHLIPPKAP